MANKFSQFIFNHYRKNEARLHQLSYLFWECTRRCNLQCLHCGSDCSADSKTDDLPFDDFLGAILPLKKTHKPDSITVAITGGEPLLREDLPECGRRLRQQGFLWGIVTNGYDYTPAIHGRLLGAGMGSISLSLDGLEPTHTWLRRNDQSFTRAVKALALISSTKHLTYDVITCVNQKNIYELENLKAFLVANNVRTWRLFTIAPIGRAAHNDDLCLSPEQLKHLFGCQFPFLRLASSTLVYFPPATSSTSLSLNASLYRTTSLIFRPPCDNFKPGRDTFLPSHY
jgi:MoaA/NifB/PqqE/SkfB family radical SAM enzyme